MAEDKDKLALTAEEKQKVIDFLAEKAPDAHCPVCGHDQLDLGDHLVSPALVRRGGGTQLGGLNYPLAMAFCTNCYHVQFFAVRPLGLPNAKPPEDDGDG